MKVVFLKNIKGVAQIGDMKNVPDGYARNFLLPGKFAKVATAGAAAEAESLKKLREAGAVEDRVHAEELAKKLEGVVVEITEGANPEGHLYGSVDAKKIAEAIHTTHHVVISSNQVELPHHIKTTGDHSVKLSLFQTIATTLTVRVLPS
ncbi:MAG: 50S ribosomal protein L9 [Patescibacteria group bacterium]